MEVPEELCALAETCLEEAGALDDAWTGAQADLSLDAGVAGNSAGGARLIAAHTSCLDAAASAVGRLSGVLEIDADSLYQVAFAVSYTDQTVAEGLESTYQDPEEPAPPEPGPAPTPFPTGVG